MSNAPITPSDDQIGQRIKTARTQAAMTQAQLGDHLGCSSQQVHKYERGSNRVSAGTLFLIAKVLEHPLEWFFLDVEKRGRLAGLDPYVLN
ncbi:MAG: helix-turn-helix transcriptional regulator [Henriciella sp.]